MSTLNLEITTKELAEKLNVSTTSIKRNVNALKRELGNINLNSQGGYLFTLNQADLIMRKINTHHNLKKYRSTEGYIYLIKQSGTNYYKIGNTKNYKNRLREFQNGNPAELILIALIKSKNPLDQELKIHSLESENNLRGEWFQFNDKEIKEVINRYNFKEVSYFG